MGSKSNFLENALLNHVLRNVSYTPPTTVYLALYTTAPTDAGGGTQVSGTSYARVAVTFAAASSGASSNSGSLTFAVAGGAWGTITAWGLFDASTGGNLLYWGTFAVPDAVLAGDQATINVGDLDVTED
jgi:hypothetical protein